MVWVGNVIPAYTVLNFRTHTVSIPSRDINTFDMFVLTEWAFHSVRHKAAYGKPSDNTVMTSSPQGPNHRIWAPQSPESVVWSVLEGCQGWYSGWGTSSSSHISIYTCKRVTWPGSWQCLPFKAEPLWPKEVALQVLRKHLTDYKRKHWEGENRPWYKEINIFPRSEKKETKQRMEKN